MSSYYAGIAKACQLIALDNGGINRYRTTWQQANDFEKWLVTYVQANDITPEQLQEADDWLIKLEPTVMDIVCCGEDTDREAAMVNAPWFLNDLLDAYFEGPC
jgi:hypothetical protein